MCCVGGRDYIWVEEINSNKDDENNDLIMV